MVYNREEAAKRAEESKTNKVGMCQQWTRTMFGAPAVGDVDGDRDADAVDGWKSEPANKRHTNRNAPRGVPGSFHGGSKGHGHRTVSLGDGLHRSTDFDTKTKRYKAGTVGTGTIAEIEKALGVKWTGWSETISGQVIPLAPDTPKKKTVAQIAKEVIAGKWGNGDDRVKRLKAAGYNPKAVQGKVNDLLKMPPSTPDPKPSGKALRVDGVDISHHQQQVIDYGAAMKAGVKWMYHKATEGATFKDNNYSKRRKEAAAAGLPFGAYHFARPDANGKDAKVEAQFFINYAKPKPGDLRPALDLETRENLSGTALIQWADEFCEEVERLTGVYPVVYTPYSLSKTLESKAVMWRPRYNNDNAPPALPYDIHQFSNGVLGKPNRVAGFGHVDLNSSSVPLKRLLIPKKEATPAKKKAVLKFAHASLQFSNTPKQHTEDITKIFSRGYDVITGTEAGPGANNTMDELKRIGALKGYRVHVPNRYDTWVAVKETLIVDSFKTGAEFALWRSSKITPKPPGRWGDKGLVWLSWNMGPTYGTIAVGAVHYLTNKGAGAALKKKSDTEYARVIQKWADTHGKGTLLAFIGGDFNLRDKNNDVFKGVANFKTCWDDMKKWPNTGHGNIDAIARYRPDGRVKCVGARVLNDKKLQLHTDHFLVEADYEITAL